MSIKIYRKRYIGKAHKELSWGELVGIFDFIWGDKNRSLPGFPEIIGNVSAFWEDAAGVEHKVTSVEELEKAYVEYKTAKIVFSGHIPENNIRSTFSYIPSKKAGEIFIQSSNIGLTESIVNKVITLFPHIEQTKKKEMDWGKISVISAIIIAIFASILTIAVPVLMEKYKTYKNNEQQFRNEQTIAYSLYGGLLHIRKQVVKKRRNIEINEIEAYLASGKTLNSEIHIQIGNLVTSINMRNFTAAKEQVDDIISRMERNYGCKISSIQAGVKEGESSASASTVIVGIEKKMILVAPNNISADTSIMEKSGLEK